MSKQTDTTEKGLEAHISQYLVEENNYLLRENKVYDNVSCIDSELLFQFLWDNPIILSYTSVI